MTPSPFPRLHAYAQNSFPAHLSMGGGGDYQDTVARITLFNTRTEQTDYIIISRIFYHSISRIPLLFFSCVGVATGLPPKPRPGGPEAATEDDPMVARGRPFFGGTAGEGDD
jgi:hypothetical protein